MNPQDNPEPAKATPERSLPRPSMQVINDIQGMQRPPRTTDGMTRPVQASAPQQPVTSTPKVSHPGDHLLEAPHEKLLEDGIEEPTPPKQKKKRSKLKFFFVFILVFIVAVIAAGVSALWWYQEQLKPVDSSDKQGVRVSIEEGSAPATISQTLKEKGVIRDVTAFSIYAKLSGTENTLKAGTYNLKKSESVQQIVDHLVSGKQDVFSLTFLPGDTLANNRKKIISAGYSEVEVDAALNKQYERPLFAGKPQGTDLEGYIFGETYEFVSTATVEQILNRTFDEFEKYIKENDLVAAYKKQNLTLYQGITLASIIQKEVSSPADSQQVAQVFYKRLKEGMPLGADATFVYAAKKEGRTPTVDFKSPYNTRINKGLPPGPISAPGLTALKAAAAPAPGDYLYFVSGDDGKNYFSKTLQEHETNTRLHCKKNCALF